MSTVVLQVVRPAIGGAGGAGAGRAGKLEPVLMLVLRISEPVQSGAATGAPSHRVPQLALSEFFQGRSMR